MDMYDGIPVKTMRIGRTHVRYLTNQGPVVAPLATLVMVRGRFINNEIVSGKVHDEVINILAGHCEKEVK